MSNASANNTAEKAEPPSAPAPREGLTPAIIFRALSASVIIAAISMPFVWGRWGPMVTRDFAFFSLWSVGNWFLLAKVIMGVVERRPKSILALQLLGMLGLLVILPLFFAWCEPNFLAFVVGFSLPYAVVVLKVAGWHLTHRSARK